MGVGSLIASRINDYMGRAHQGFPYKVFFPPSKTASLRNESTSFAQIEDESLYRSWQWFKDLLRLFPHRGL